MPESAPRRRVTPRHLRAWWTVAWLLLAMLGLPATAAEADPPGRVGRISLAHGVVDAIVEAGGAWESAVLNSPVTTGSSLRTSAGSRAEVRIGTAALQMNANTTLKWRVLDDQSLLLDLLAGNVAFTLPMLAGGERVEVHAGAVRFVVTAPGSYHVQHAVGANRVEVRVFQGSGSFVDLPIPLALASGQMAQVDARTLGVIQQAPAQATRFDEWAAQRAQRGGASIGRFVPPEMTGAEELDLHGRWREEPRIGPVWYPHAVDAEWAPYRHGRWVWVSPWGWNWVDDAVWGFAPFHYGRWLFLGGRWGWVPGSNTVRPAYAPALVGFYAAAPAGPSPWVGWFPLAPGEVYRPTFAVSASYLQTVNAAPPGQRDAAPGRYRYAQTSFAATAVEREAFGSGQPAAAHRVALQPSELAAARVIDVGAAPPLPRAPSRNPPVVPAPTPGPAGPLSAGAPSDKVAERRAARAQARHVAPEKPPARAERSHRPAKPPRMGNAP